MSFEDPTKRPRESSLTAILENSPLMSRLLTPDDEMKVIDYFYQDLTIEILKIFGYSRDDYYRLSQICNYRQSCEFDLMIAEKIKQNSDKGETTGIINQMFAGLQLLSPIDIPGYFDDDIKESGGQISQQDSHAFSIVSRYDEWDLFALYSAPTVDDWDVAFKKLADLLEGLVPITIIETALRNLLASDKYVSFVQTDKPEQNYTDEQRRLFQ